MGLGALLKKFTKNQYISLRKWSKLATLYSIEMTDTDNCHLTFKTVNSVSVSL